MNNNNLFLENGSLRLPLKQLTWITDLYLLPQLSSWSYNFIKDMFSYVWIYSTEWIIQQVDISIKIYSTSQTDALFLTSTQVNTLKSDRDSKCYDTFMYL